MQNEVILPPDAEGSVFGDRNAARAEFASLRPFDDPAAGLRTVIETSQVVVPEGATVVRVTVSQGEAIELPFGPDAHFTARLGDGNLAIKVGDVVIILEGYNPAGE